MEEKLQQLEQKEELFYSNKEQYLQKVLVKLHAQLENLLVGQDEEFIALTQDLEELRDRELVSLYLYEKYRQDRAKQQYDEDMEAIDRESSKSAATLNDRLKVRFQAYVDYHKHAHSSTYDIDGDSKNGGGAGSSSMSNRLLAFEESGTDNFDLRHFEDWTQPITNRKHREVTANVNYTRDADSGSGSGTGTATGTGLNSNSGYSVGSTRGGAGGPGRRPKIDGASVDEIASDMKLLKKK